MPVRPLNIGVTASDDYDATWWHQTLRQIYEWSRTMFGGKAYTVTNLSESRTFDASAATLDQTRQVLATLIDDLKNGKLPE